MTEQATSQEIAAQKAAEEAAARAETHRAIKANFDNRVDVKEAKFGFKTVELIDPATEKPIIDETTKKPKTYRRPTVELDLPVPSMEGIISIIESGTANEQKLLLDAVADVVLQRARQYVNETEDVNQQNFPMDILRWRAIADIPPKERKGNGLPKETWEAFQVDYIAVLQEAGRQQKEAETQAKLLVAKFQPVKTAKKVIKFLLDQLDVYSATTKKMSEFEDHVSFLQDKGKALLEADEKDLLANLGMKME